MQRKPMQTTGNLIMTIAEAIRPHLMRMFEGARDEQGLAVQPARVRAISLNVAQRLVKENKLDYFK